MVGGTDEAGSEVALRINPPTPDEIGRLAEGATLIGVVWPGPAAGAGIGIGGASEAPGGLPGSPWLTLGHRGSMPLDRVRDVLQIAFGWEDMNLHRFTDSVPFAPCGRLTARFPRQCSGCPDTELPHSLVGEGGSRLELLKMGKERCVDNVNRFGIGLGRTSVGLARIVYVFGRSQ